MAVLISSKVKGQTQEGYDGVLLAVRDHLKNAPGFIMHCAHPAEGEWSLYEVWESKAEADQWFATYVVPNIPKGLHPKRSYQELHSMITAFEKSFKLS
jgi:quinol monooxygenase YgiN